MVCIDDLDLDRETREKVVEHLESAEKLDDRAPQFAEQQRQRARDLAGVDPETDTLSLERDPDAGTVADLRDAGYSFADLTDERTLEREIRTLSRRYDAVESKTPNYAEESLKPRLDALKQLRSEIASNDYVDARTWDALSECLDDSEIETLGGGGEGA